MNKQNMEEKQGKISSETRGVKHKRSELKNKNKEVEKKRRAEKKCIKTSDPLK